MASRARRIWAKDFNIRDLGWRRGGDDRLVEFLNHESEKKKIELKSSTYRSLGRILFNA
jgi:hypothetical protein